MKKTKFSRKLLSLFALTMALMMVLASTASAADNTKTEPAPYTILRGGAVQLADYDEIRTCWNGDGCQMESCFLTGESMLRRLRLTFDGAYNLYDVYQTVAEATKADSVLYNYSYQRYGYKNLRYYLTDSVLNACYDADGAKLLRNLKASSTYRRNATVKWLVDAQLSVFESYHAPQLRRTLAYYCSETILQNMDFAQLKAMAESIIATPEYVQFRNTLYEHDCSTVNELMAYGYSLDYVARLYSSRAEAAVKAIWPDYVERMNSYWLVHRSW